MRTPTFPAPPRKEKPPLADALRAIGEGPVRARDVAALSDLGRMESAEFRRAFAGWPEATRVAVVRRMAELAEDRVELIFGRALRVALDDASPAVRQLAVAALWEDEGADLGDRLLALVRTDPSQDVRAEAAEGLARFVDGVAAGEVGGDVGRALLETLRGIAEDPSEPYLLRRRALESVAALGRDPEVRELIERAFDSDEPGLRASAIYAMGRSLDPSWSDTALGELASDDAEVVYEAARACGSLGDERAVEPLAELAREPDPDLRRVAITALGQVGGRRAVRLLRELQAMEQESDVDRELIADALEEAVATLEPV